MEAMETKEAPRRRILAAVLSLGAALGIAIPASALADRYILQPGAATVTVPACGSGGGTSATLPVGQYILAVTGADATVCYAATCATGGMTLVVGSQIPIYNETSRSVSCRSDAGGAVQFIRAERG